MTGRAVSNSPGRKVIGREVIVKEGSYCQGSEVIVREVKLLPWKQGNLLTGKEVPEKL